MARKATYQIAPYITDDDDDSLEVFYPSPQFYTDIKDALADVIKEWGKKMQVLHNGEIICVVQLPKSGGYTMVRENGKPERIPPQKANIDYLRTPSGYGEDFDFELQHHEFNDISEFARDHSSNAYKILVDGKEIAPTYKSDNER